MADIMAVIACEMSKSTVKGSPFSIEYSRRAGQRHHGGKDNITVVVVFVVSSDS